MSRVVPKPVILLRAASALKMAAGCQRGPVEVLVNNAGITRDGTLHRMGHEVWQVVLDTNLGSCYNMCRCVIDSMRKRGFGRIVNVGSVNGQAGQYGQVNYAAAKSGIHGFTKALAQEGAARGITVNAIAPGYVHTDMVRAVPEQVLEEIIAGIPVGRLGRAEDISRAAAFLVADDADFITGATLSINGRSAHVLTKQANITEFNRLIFTSYDPCRSRSIGSQDADTSISFDKANSHGYKEK